MSSNKVILQANADLSGKTLVSNSKAMKQKNSFVGQ